MIINNKIKIKTNGFFNLQFNFFIKIIFGKKIPRSWTVILKKYLKSKIIT